MAKPQKENGYTAIANEIMDALAKTRISGEARQVLDVIFRKTYGWNKKEDCISLSQFVYMTGLKKTAIIRAIYKLSQMNLIIKKDNQPINNYKINKDFSSWNPLSKKITNYKRESSLKGYCYICNFTKVLERHHIKLLSAGGMDRVANIVILCPNCHTLVHKGEYNEKFLLIKKDNAENVIKKDNSDKQKVKKGLSKKLPTKDTITKDTITKTIVDLKHFEFLWNKYPNKDGRKAACKHYVATVKTVNDKGEIEQALDKYLNHLAVNTWLRPKNGSTWFNNWQDWVNWIEPPKPKKEEHQIGGMDGLKQFIHERGIKL